MRAMKDSGVEWIGVIPIEWQSLRIRNICKRISENQHPDATVLSLYRDLGIVIKSERDDNFNRTSENTDNYKFVKQFDLVVNKMKAWQGSIAVSLYQGIVSPAYYVFHFTHAEVFPFYIHHLLRCSVFLPEYRRLSGGIRPDQWDLNENAFLNITIVLPPLSQQKRIAGFLDAKCAQIDAIIEKQQQVIEKLKAYKQSVITEAVTKGLDPTVPMKDSGVEWIGMVPEHWDVIRLRYIGSCQNGISKGGESFGTGYPFVSYSDVYKNEILPYSVDGLVESNESEQDNFSVRLGDVFFTRTSETIEEVGLASVCFNSIEKATFAGFLIRMRPYNGIIKTHFSMYYFRCIIHRAFLTKEMNIVTRASLGQELLKRLPVLLPPQPEQVEIAQYLKAKCDNVDEMIGHRVEVVSKITAYKKSLIYEAITGKMEVL